MDVAEPVRSIWDFIIKYGSVVGRGIENAGVRPILKRTDLVHELGRHAKSKK